MPEREKVESILEHYRGQAEEHGLQPTSTMLDSTTREFEIEAIVRCVEYALKDSSAQFLEVGCGNGYLLNAMRASFPEVHLTGIDYSPEMVALASRREIPDCTVQREDVGTMSFSSDTFDIAVSERCLINLPEESMQAEALKELHRVLKPGGHLVVVEGFTDGLANLNRARVELGLPENVVPDFNRWFDEEVFLSATEGLFELVADADPSALPSRNFLSTHYFISRVLYPSVTTREILHNTEFVKFFRFLPPQGDFSPIQLYFMRKIG